MESIDETQFHKIEETSELSPAPEMSLSGVLSSDVCNKLLHSVSNAAKDFLRPEKIFSFTVQSNRIVCIQKVEQPPPPPTRQEVYEAQRIRYRLHEPHEKSTMEVAASLHSPASLREFLLAEHEAQELSRAYEEAELTHQQPRNFRQVVATHGFIKLSEAPVQRPEPGRRRMDLPVRRRTAEYWDACCRPVGPPPLPPTIALSPHYRDAGDAPDLEES